MLVVERKLSHGKRLRPESIIVIRAPDDSVIEVSVKHRSAKDSISVGVIAPSDYKVLRGELLEDAHGS